MLCLQRVQKAYVCKGKVWQFLQLIWILKEDNPENVGSKKILELFGYLHRCQLPSLQFLELGSFLRKAVNVDEVNLIDPNLAGYGFCLECWELETRLSQVLRSSGVSFRLMLNEFLGTTNDFFAELNWNKFIKSVHYITGTCTLVFFL